VRIRGNFGQLDDVTTQIRNTVERVQQEMDTWATTAGVTSADWLDRAGDQFNEVTSAWQQVSAAQQAMLQALGGGVQTTNDELQQALASAATRVGNTPI
jgi:hypothetical protein